MAVFVTTLCICKGSNPCTLDGISTVQGISTFTKYKLYPFSDSWVVFVNLLKFFENLYGFLYSYSPSDESSLLADLVVCCLNLSSISFWSGIYMLSSSLSC